jgi:hypothetical protein
MWKKWFIFASELLVVQLSIHDFALQLSILNLPMINSLFELSFCES